MTHLVCQRGELGKRQDCLGYPASCVVNWNRYTSCGGRNGHSCAGQMKQDWGGTSEEVVESSLWRRRILSFRLCWICAPREPSEDCWISFGWNQLGDLEAGGKIPILPFCDAYHLLIDHLPVW